MSTKNKLIKIKNLKKFYINGEVETKALNGVDLEVVENEFVAIMGPSGSGKSTLMQIIGLLDRPTEGEYWLAGKDTLKFSDNDLARLRNQKIGFIFQTFNLLARTTVYENVELPLLYAKKKIKNKQKKVIQALEAVGMKHRLHHYSNQLSGGEKQRVAIARALINNPEIILADEPTGNLDSKSGLQVMNILQDLHKKGHTIVLVTHETFTAEHAERILHMLDGKIIKDESVEKRRFAQQEDFLK